jgi:hypothetical protein
MKAVYVVMVVWMIVLTGCNAHNVPTARAWMFDHPPGDSLNYPENYIVGWQDGCETAGSATANTLYKFRYSFQQDEYLAVNDRTYRKGWDDAYLYCTSYLLQHNFNWFGKRPI